MFCPKCGKQIQDDAIFCQHSGAAVNQAATASEPAITEGMLCKKCSDVFPMDTKLCPCCDVYTVAAPPEIIAEINAHRTTVDPCGIKCPKCRSTQVLAQKTNFSVAKTVVFLPLGIQGNQ